MTVYTCKMCGAPLKITEGMTVCECEYCGTSQTLPKIGDEKRIAAINRANHLRQSGDFDRAEQVYEDLIAQEESGELYGNVDGAGDVSRAEELAAIRQMDADLFWSLTLCRYGIEYVTDPTTGRKIPTCHRLQYKNILDDDDYRRAVSYADFEQKELILSEARYISNVQKRILEISKQEDPYDVFICYKESDEQGTRTKDSVLAQDMYYLLVREGFKVFFARVTLEGKLGTEYEPYIFAALHSAKTMIVIGTKKEYFEAPWVKNEWMRYLAIMKEDRSRRLIPAYQGMDPYDLPDALATFQAQDMSKLGFMQDILANIGRMAQEESGKNSAIRETLVVADMTETAPLLRRIGYFLEDGEFDRAAQYCDRVLNIEPECAQAYVYKLMVEKKAHTLEELEWTLDEDGITYDDSYKKAIRFADPELKEKLKRLDQQMIYNDAVSKMQKTEDLVLMAEAVSEFRTIPGFKDADEKLLECIVLKKELLEKQYNEATQDMARLLDPATPRYASPFFKLAQQFDTIAHMQPDEELSGLERDQIRICIQISADKTRECKYLGAVAELDRATLPNDVKTACMHLEELGDYKDARKLASACRSNIKNREMWRLTSAARTAERVAQETAERERSVGGSERSFRDLPAPLQVIIALGIAAFVIVILYGFLTGKLTLGELFKALLEIDD